MLDLIRAGLPSVRDVAYLNAGTNGPLPAAAAEAAAEMAQRDAREPRLGMPYFEGFLELRERSRAAAARVVGAPPEEVALTSSTTQGIGLVLAGLALEPGGEALTTTEEHPGLLAPLEVLARRTGLVVREVAADDLPAAITPDTRVVGISHALWTTGRVLDLAAIAARGHEAGAVVVVDGAQSGGQLALRMADTGADAYAFSGQKWLMGPFGSGALWLHRRLHDRLTPVTPSYLSLEHGEVGHWKDTAARYDGGSIDPVTTAAFVAALEWVESLPGGRDAFQAMAGDAAGRARAALDAAGIDRARNERETGIIAVTVPGAAEEAVEHLAGRGVLVRSIPGTPYVRASIGAWTSDEDIGRLVDGLRSVPG